VPGFISGRARTESALLAGWAVTWLVGAAAGALTTLLAGGSAPAVLGGLVLVVVGMSWAREPTLGGGCLVTTVAVVAGVSDRLVEVATVPTFPSVVPAVRELPVDAGGVIGGVVGAGLLDTLVVVLVEAATVPTVPPVVPAVREEETPVDADGVTGAAGVVVGAGVSDRLVVVLVETATVAMFPAVVPSVWEEETSADTGVATVDTTVCVVLSTRWSPPWAGGVDCPTR
jgi:hypothetical protein